MTSDDENPNKRSLNPLEDFELDDENNVTDEDLDDVDEIIDASPLGSELDNEDYAGDEDTDFAAELSAMPNDDIDTDVDGTPAFDTEDAYGAPKKRGGMRKMLAPALVLAVAAGAAGYIMMNPAILGGGDTGQPSIDTTNVAGDFDAEAEALRQAQSTAASTPEDSGLGGMGSDLPQPSVNMNEQDDASAVPEDDNAMLSPDETINDIMNAGDEMSAALDEPEEEMPEEGADESAPEFENDLPSEVSVEPPAMNAQTAEDADTVDVAANKTAETPEENVVPRGPQEMTAEPVVPVEEDPVRQEPVEEEPAVEQSRDAAGMEPAETEPVIPQDNAAEENNIFERDFQNIVSEDEDRGGSGNADSAQIAQPSSQDDDSFYDSEMRVPQGQVSGPRKLDPRVEPATSLVVATQDYKADDQESLVVAANRALKLRRYEAALDMFNSLYSKNKRDKRILMGLAVAQQNTGRVESAINSYEALLEIDPENTDAMVNMLGLIKEQYPSVALRRMLDLQGEYPGHAGLSAQIGITQADLGQYQDAMRYLGRAASLDPQNPQHLFNLAIVADRQGKTREAIGFYEQALEVDTVYTSGRALPRETIYDRLSNLRRR